MRRPKAANGAMANKILSLKNAARLSVSTATIDGPERARMIAEAAYYHAVQRGFELGHELDDWLAAEIEIKSSTLQRVGGEP